MFGAIGSIISALAGSAAQNAGLQFDYQNLAFQKDNAKKQYGLATAARTDAYGNEQSFDQLLKKWNIKLTPTQEAILRAGEHEQKLSLTEDAQRNRELRRRQETRSLEADRDYNDARTGWRYDQPQSEGAIRGEQQLLLGLDREDRTRGNQAGLMRQAMRLGRGGDIPSIIKAIAQQGGAGMGGDLIKARTGALAESQAREAGHRQKYLPAMQQFAQVQDDIGQAGQKYSTVPQEMGAQQSDMIQTILQSLTNESGQVGDAYKSIAARLASGGLNLDLGGLDSMFGGGGGGGAKGAASPSSSLATPSLVDDSWGYGFFGPDEQRTKRYAPQF